MARVLWANHKAKLEKTKAILKYFRNSIQNFLVLAGSGKHYFGSPRKGHEISYHVRLISFQNTNPVPVLTAYETASLGLILCR